MLCGSAFKNKGVQAMLDAVIDYMPSPTTSRRQGHREVEAPRPRGPATTTPFSALAFKILNDPFVGNLTFFRVYSGVLNSGDRSNPCPAVEEGAHRPPAADARQPSARRSRKSAPATSPRRSGLKDVTTGDTLCDENIIIAREDGVPGARDLGRRRAEDQVRPGKDGPRAAAPRQGGPVVPRFDRPESGQTIISGMGELHLEIIVDRMKREFKVEANVGKPQVAYRETIRGKVEARSEGQVRPPVGGRGQYGHVAPDRAERRGKGLRVRQRHRRRRRAARVSRPSTEGVKESARTRRDRRLPRRRRQGHDLRRFVPRRRLERNGVQDRRLDGRQGRRAKAKPGLLEPIMKVEVVTPEDYSGDVIGDLNRRRGQIPGMEDGPSGRSSSRVPLAEMFGYATVRSMSRAAPPSRWNSRSTWKCRTTFAERSRRRPAELEGVRGRGWGIVDRRVATPVSLPEPGHRTLPTIPKYPPSPFPRQDPRGLPPWLRKKFERTKPHVNVGTIGHVTMARRR